MTKRSHLNINPSLLYTHTGEVSDDTNLQLASLGMDASINGSSIVLHQSIVTKSSIANAPNLQVRKSRLETIDAANADLERSGWSGSEISGSRFTGSRLNHAHISKTVFMECRMNLMQCQQSTLQHVRFEKCDLRGAYFNMSSMAGTVFEGSDLTGADFSGALIQGCDFRRATIEDIRVAPDQMAGVIVTADQALYLARLFGLEIQE